MKDLIWTIIVIWVIYKLITVFKTISIQRTNSTYQNEKENLNNTNQKLKNPSKKEIKDAVQKHMNKEGDYVDFEEIK